MRKSRRISRKLGIRNRATNGDPNENNRAGRRREAYLAKHAAVMNRKQKARDRQYEEMLARKKGVEARQAKTHARAVARKDLARQKKVVVV